MKHLLEIQNITPILPFIIPVLPLYYPCITPVLPLYYPYILDFKQVFQFDSPQISQIFKIFLKMQARYKFFQKKTFLLTVFHHMLSNCSF